MHGGEMGSVDLFRGRGRACIDTHRVSYIDVHGEEHMNGTHSGGMEVEE